MRKIMIKIKISGMKKDLIRDVVRMDQRERGC
jgi:hypothetical protein